MYSYCSDADVRREMSSTVERMDECATELGVVCVRRQRRQCEICSVNPTERAESKLFQQSERAIDKETSTTSSSVKVDNLRNVRLYFCRFTPLRHYVYCRHTILTPRTFYNCVLRARLRSTSVKPVSFIFNQTLQFFRRQLLFSVRDIL